MSLSHVLLAEDDLLPSLLCIPGVFVLPGAGIGAGGTGPGTGFFPGNRASDNYLEFKQHSHNKVYLPLAELLQLNNTTEEQRMS